MLELPKNLDENLRSAYQRHLDAENINQALSGLTSGTLDLFDAQQAFFMFQSEKHAKPLFEFVDCSAKDPDLAQVDYSQDFDKRFLKQWTQSEIHQRVTKDLLLRLSAISYSAFSWPYARFSIEKDPLSGGEISFPRDYSIFLPFSSSSVLRHTEEAEFFGYLAVFFSNFPQFSDEIVQLVIVLPELLSNIAASYLRLGD